MSSLLSIAVSLANVLAMQAGGYDLAVVEKWEKAKVVRYHVEGVHVGRESVVHGDYEGKADVTDRVTVEFTWDRKKGKVVGPVTVTDGKTELKNIRSDGTNCPPPQLKGEYEHFQTVSHSMISGDQIQIKGTRTYPPAMVSNYPGSCSMRSIPGAKEDASLFVGGADPAALGTPIRPGGPLVVAADRKSFSMKGAENWVWTFTPTLVP
ncbi:MAG TPA: hypothetical protein VGM13_08320 [Thermoanaerobaculia bacterium]|jgi:hypothetical protein